MSNRPKIHRRKAIVSKAQSDLASFLSAWAKAGLTINEQLNLLASEIASITHHEIRGERNRKLDIVAEVQFDAKIEREDAAEEPDKPPSTGFRPPTKCRGLMDTEQLNTCKQMGVEPSECCDRAGEYNGFGSGGPTRFSCTKPGGCACHD